MQRAGRGPGERGLFNRGKSRHEMTHGAVIINAQRRKADARRRVRERLIDRADRTEFDPRMIVVRNRADFVIVFGGEDDGAVVADGVGQRAVGGRIRPGGAEDDVEHDGFGPGGFQAAEQFGVEFARPGLGGIKIAFGVGWEVEIDDYDGRIVGGRQIDSAPGVQRIIAGMGEIILPHRAQQREAEEGDQQHEQKTGREPGSFHLRLRHVAGSIFPREVFGEHPVTAGANGCRKWHGRPALCFQPGGASTLR